MKRKLLIAVPLLALVTLVAWMLRPKHETLSEAFVSEKTAPLLSSIAQVREQVGILHYGERVEVVGKRNDFVKVRTNAGTVGWVESRQLMEPALWQRSVKLLDQTRGMPVQSRGRTKVSTNLGVQPGRSERRLYIFGRNVRVRLWAVRWPIGCKSRTRKTLRMSRRKRRRRTGFWSVVSQRGRPGKPRLARPNPQTQRNPAIKPCLSLAGWSRVSSSLTCRNPCAKERPLQTSVRWHGLN